MCPASSTGRPFMPSIFDHYELFGNYSPHNELIQEHVESLKIKVQGAQYRCYLALLDEVPRIRDSCLRDLTAGL